MKRVFFISSSDHYAHRFSVLDAYLRAQGCETTFLTSDFDHVGKKQFVCKVPNCVQIPAKPYKKNLSLARILSHRAFARDAFAYLESLPEQPDLVVVLLPPNFLGHYAAKYRKEHPQVKLIFDIFDMWPETFPSGKAKKLLAPFFAVWAAIRDRSLDSADFVMTECELFRQKLTLPAKTSACVYLAGSKPDCSVMAPAIREDVIELCYLGSINNIISIPDICNLIRELTAHKPVKLHIIGKGEKQEQFQQAARQAGAEVVFYGPVYDDETKMRIMSQCRFGLNVMKASVCIGLTMKSVDYFRFGLPIINTIPADTRTLVSRRGIGLALDSDCAGKILRMSPEECVQMRHNVQETFAELFEQEQIRRQYEGIFARFL